MNNIVSVKGDSASRFLRRKGKGEKSIYGDDKLLRGGNVCVYQDNFCKKIRKPLQLVVPLEVMNMIRNDEEVNEPSNKQPTMLASLSADLICQLST